MKLSIVVIGDELLIGQVTDTNSGEIARTLGPLGWELAETYVIGDDGETIRRTVGQAMEQSDLVITTGGLGPTKDDITKHVLLSIFGGEMREDPAVRENVERIFAKRHLQLNQLTLGQAMVPTSCRVIQNEFGTAPIMWFERDGKVLISMPGVPFETRGMIRGAVKDEIKRHFTPHETQLHHTLMATGITESALAERLDAYEQALPTGMHLAFLPQPGYIRLRLDATADTDDAAKLELKFATQVDRLKQAVGPHLLYDGDASPAQILLERLKERGFTLATAESCTGGNIAHHITSIPGSSESYLGGVVSYSNDVKHRLLGVSQADLDAYGAVSQPVALQMAAGAARAINADCAMATTGIAGPGGGTPDKPVGTVWIAAHTPAGTEAKLLRLPGDRSRVIDRATTEAILFLLAKMG
ncbi:MAG: CinA family nicotinamide mononucleotide deamidase-related protein [Bacteroidales bacterium]|nr:CinA family nicotinamide mononucleotide deamidase-related protein [Bacteroidales bacterium]